MESNRIITIIPALLLLFSFGCSASIQELAKARDVNGLVQKLKDKDWYVRKNAAEALGEIGDKRAVEPLIAILEDPYWRIRSDAVLALGKIGDERAVEPLVAAIRDKELDVRRMPPIARIGWKPVNQTVHIVNLIALKEWDEVVKIGAPAVEPLIAALRDKDSTVRLGGR